LGRSNGCGGGYVPDVWEYIKTTGIVTGNGYNDEKWCMPFIFPECSHYSTDTSVNPLCTNKKQIVPACKELCNGTKYTAKSYQNDKLKANTYKIVGEADMMKEIYSSGPIEATIYLFDDLLVFSKGIYSVSSGSNYLSNHAIKIIGWGEHDGVKYWIIANTWNETWGEKGFFNMKRGSNEAHIEAESFSGTPSWPKADNEMD